MMGFHAQIGARVRTSEALEVASSLFSEGIEKYDKSEHAARAHAPLRHLTLRRAGPSAKRSRRRKWS